MNFVGCTRKANKTVNCLKNSLWLFGIRHEHTQLHFAKVFTALSESLALNQFIYARIACRWEKIHCDHAVQQLSPPCNTNQLNFPLPALRSSLPLYGSPYTRSEQKRDEERERNRGRASERMSDFHIEHTEEALKQETRYDIYALHRVKPFAWHFLFIQWKCDAEYVKGTTEKKKFAEQRMRIFGWRTERSEQVQTWWI